MQGFLSRAERSGAEPSLLVICAKIIFSDWYHVLDMVDIDIAWGKLLLSAYYIYLLLLLSQKGAVSGWNLLCTKHHACQQLVFAALKSDMPISGL